MSIPKTHVRVNEPDKKKAQEFLTELSYIERRTIKMPEYFRRVNNSPEIKELLKRDAEIKKMKRENKR